MDWTRIILDGLVMTAYFNLFAAVVVLYNPRLMFPCYPPAIVEDATEPPTKAEKHFYRRWIVLGIWIPLIFYSSISTVLGGMKGFWNLALAGYVQWMMINLGDLIFLDMWLFQKKGKKRFIIPGTEGHSGYQWNNWMKQYALPEHLLQWPLLICPLMAAAQAGLGVLITSLFY